MTALSDTDREYAIHMAQLRLATADNEDERREAEVELERLNGEEFASDKARQNANS